MTALKSDKPRQSRSKKSVVNHASANAAAVPPSTPKRSYEPGYEPDVSTEDVKFDIKFVTDFLIRYNYHDEGVVDGKSLKVALERYQAFHAIPITGKVDAVTLALINSPRCGIPENRKVLNQVLRQARRLQRVSNDGDTSQNRNDLKQKGKRRALAITSFTSASQLLVMYCNCRWNKKIKKLRYSVDTIPAGLDSQKVDQACELAFRTWSAALQIAPDPPLIEFEVANPPLSADIHIQWVISANDPDGELGTAIAHADYPPACGVHAAPKPIHLDFDRTWSVTIAAHTEFDFQTILLHEIGHILGLDHAPSTVQGSIMMDPLPSGLTQRQPSGMDIHVLQKCYRLIP